MRAAAVIESMAALIGRAWRPARGWRGRLDVRVSGVKARINDAVLFGNRQFAQTRPPAMQSVLWRLFDFNNSKQKFASRVHSGIILHGSRSGTLRSQ